MQHNRANLQAKLTYPSQPLAVRAGAPNLPPPRNCLPISLGHNGAAWRFLRNGTAVAPDVSHSPIRQVVESGYPRFDNEIAYSGWSRLFQDDLAPGFGALHVYGQDAPSRGAYAPAGAADVWALPPSGNSADNDQLMWSGVLTFVGEQHNGRMRIDVTVATDCKLLTKPLRCRFSSIWPVGSSRGTPTTACSDWFPPSTCPTATPP